MFRQYTAIATISKATTSAATSVARSAAKGVTPAFSMATRSIGIATARSYATAGPTPSPGVASFISKIQGNPAIMQELKNINDLMVSKGLIPKPEDMVDASGNIKKLTVTQQMKIFMDSDVRSAIGKLGKDLHDSGIEFGPEDVKAMSEFMQTQESSKDGKDGKDGNDKN